MLSTVRTFGQYFSYNRIIKGKQQEDTTMSDKIYRFIASLFLLFEDDLEGDFGNDPYVAAQRAKQKKIRLAPREEEPTQIPHAG